MVGFGSKKNEKIHAQKLYCLTLSAQGNKNPAPFFFMNENHPRAKLLAAFHPSMSQSTSIKF